MTTAALARCPACRAMVNLRWATCLVCKAPLVKVSADIEAGDLITWLGCDGKTQGPAQVDVIHTDEDGTVWAFVTLPDGWAAVNTKYATVVR